MDTNTQLQIVKDLLNKKINVTRYFNANLEPVWRAWTEAELLDQWWAPRPWKAETKEMNFADNGTWLYAMVSPENEKHWSKVNFSEIHINKSFKATSGFSDGDGNMNSQMPKMQWYNQFFADGEKTKMLIEISFDKEADMQGILQMGFEGGFSMGLNNLDELLAGQ